jgi:transposase
MEGHLVMSERERERLVVMASIKEEQITIREASEILAISYRQAKRVYGRYRKQGAKGLVHKSRGRASNRAMDSDLRKEIVDSYRGRYEGFGPTFSAEKLAEEGYKIDHETLRRWLIKEGLWQKRPTRKSHRKWRERRHHFGELVQMDGSHHGWFGRAGGESCLMNMVDDATGSTFAMLDREETTELAMRTLWGWVKQYGVPAALYVDRLSVYVTDREPSVEEQLAGQRPLTHFGKACKKLGIRIIAAYSAQAKGRVERNNAVHQDRLVKELQLEKIQDNDTANAFLAKKYLKAINKKFTVLPASPADYHRPVPEGLDLRTVFCREEERQVNNDWTVQYKNRYFQIVKENQPLPRTREKILISEWLNGSIHLIYKGGELKFKELPCRPIKEMVLKATSIKPRKKYIPAADHPWRQFRYGKVNRGDKLAYAGGQN